MAPNGLRRHERLRLKRDFDRVFSEGESVSNEYLRVVYAENGLDHRRMAVVVRKGAGKAHVRNRLKRLVREAYRRNKDVFPNGIDMVFVYRKNVSGVAEKLDYWRVEKIVRDLAERMG